MLIRTFEYLLDNEFLQTSLKCKSTNANCHDECGGPLEEGVVNNL